MTAIPTTCNTATVFCALCGPRDFEAVGYGDTDAEALAMLCDGESAETIAWFQSKRSPIQWWRGEEISPWLRKAFGDFVRVASFSPSQDAIDIADELYDWSTRNVGRFDGSERGERPLTRREIAAAYEKRFGRYAEAGELDWLERQVL